MIVVGMRIAKKILMIRQSRLRQTAQVGRKIKRMITTAFLATVVVRMMLVAARQD